MRVEKHAIGVLRAGEDKLLRLARENGKKYEGSRAVREGVE